MSKIKIKNFGPVKEGCMDNDGWLDIKKVTVFIGNQGSGKSTVAKLISTFTWIEKVLKRGDYDTKWFSLKNKLKIQYLNYHRIENYLNNYDSIFDNTQIEYSGEAYYIKYEKGKLNIQEINNKLYPLPQIMYVPAERNFIAYVKNPKELKLTSAALQEFLTEFDNAKNELNGSIKLPINDVELEYFKLNNTVYIKGKDYRIKLTEASSGFQSLVPLYLVSWFLSNSIKKQSEQTSELMTGEQQLRFRKQMKIIIENTDLSELQKRIAISEEAKKFNKTAFINIVEEPEQNLFPNSQRQMLNSLLEFNNINEGNKLIITTHSPYLINYLTLAIQASYLQNRIIKSTNFEILSERLNKIVPLNSVISSENTIIYQFDENNGIFTRLPSPEGIPSDKNYLNQSIGQSNQMFDSLLEIEEEF